MFRLAGIVVIGVLAVSVAQGHFPYIVPDEKGTTAQVVFSDDLKPDPNVNIEKLAATKLTLRDVTGKEMPLEWKKADHWYSIELPGSGTRVVYGRTDYGVLQKGDAKPFLLIYFPKAVVGSATAKEATIGEKLPLEVVAVKTAGKVKFQVLALGKPVADSEVTVILPDSGKKAVKTDKEGLTPEFDNPGRYAVTAKLVEARGGEHAGKRFEEVRNYATLVCDVNR